MAYSRKSFKKKRRGTPRKGAFRAQKKRNRRYNSYRMARGGIRV